MNNYQKASQTFRRYKAHVSPIGMSQLHLRNPVVVAWWSAAFPGVGHLLLNRYLRGYMLFFWEILVNLQSHLNSAMVYSFCGEIDKAKEVLEPRWIVMYIPVYIFCIWDSYRSTADMNKLYLLADRENAPFHSFSINSIEVNYLDKRNPVMTVVWSLFMPGLGQLYLQRVLNAIFLFAWTIVFFYYSKALMAVHLLFMGHLEEATMTLDRQWLLFMPSIWGFNLYDSYVNTVENNKLFKKEQRDYLILHFRSPHFRIKKGKVVL